MALRLRRFLRSRKAVSLPNVATALEQSLQGYRTAIATEVIDFVKQRCGEIPDLDPFLAHAVGVAVGNRRPEQLADASRLVETVISRNGPPGNVSNVWSPSYWRRELDAKVQNGRRRFFYVPGRDDGECSLLQIIAEPQRNGVVPDRLLNIGFGNLDWLLDRVTLPWQRDFLVEVTGVADAIDRICLSCLSPVENRESLCARLLDILPRLLAFLSLPAAPEALVEAIRAARSFSGAISGAEADFKVGVSRPYWTEGDHVLVRLELRQPTGSQGADPA
jgi:hypothetical protein